MLFEDDTPVRPNGNTIRRLRHERGWGPQSLIEAIRAARLAATGLRETITPNLLDGIEDQNEEIPYDTLCWIASGLDCDPIELVLDEEEDDDA